MAGGAGAQDAPGVFGDHEGGPSDACLAGSTVGQASKPEGSGGIPAALFVHGARGPRPHGNTGQGCPVHRLAGSPTHTAGVGEVAFGCLHRR